MKYNYLGETGIKVSQITLGMMSYGDRRPWQLEIDEARPFVEKALDLGINFFDTANMYARGRSEEITGELLKDYRDDVVIATKVFFPMGDGPNESGLNRYHVNQQLEKSLERLQTDRIDLYQIHRRDYNTSWANIMRTLNQFIDRGGVLHIGSSSMYAWELATANMTAENLGLEPFATLQNHYNAIYREEEREMIPYARQQGMGIIPWSPLARGILAGKYEDKATTKRAETDGLRDWYQSDNDKDVLDAVKQAADENEISMAQMSLAWLLSRPGVTSPIVGATKIQHLEEAAEVPDLEIDHDHFDRISEAYTVRQVAGHSYNS